MCGRYPRINGVDNNTRQDHREAAQGTNRLCLALLNPFQTIAQTYLKPSKMLNHSNAWSEICTLSRIILALAFNPQSSLDTQLFLPDLFHTIILLLGTGPLLMRQTVYGLLLNLLLSLASSPLTGEMDGPTLQHLLMRIQDPDMITAFGLVEISGSLELAGGQQSEADVGHLAYIEEMAKFFGQVIEAGAVSIGRSVEGLSADNRMRKCMASSMDGPSGWHMLSTQPCDSTSGFYSPRSPSIR